MRVANVIQQLREHGVHVSRLVFGFKPDFIGLNVNQAFGDFFEFERGDVGVFYVFLGLNVLQLGV